MFQIGGQPYTVRLQSACKDLGQCHTSVIIPAGSRSPNRARQGLRCTEVDFFELFGCDELLLL